MSFERRSLTAELFLESVGVIDLQSLSEYEEIDVSTWYRRDAYEFFREYEDPFFNMTARVDVTRLDGLCKRESLSFAISFLFCSQETVNSIDEFRTRLADGKLIRFERVESTQAILLENESFGFCYFPWRAGLRDFNEAGRTQVAKYRKLATFDVETERLDLVYYSVIPWISFTSFKHASRSDREQTVPRIVFGKKTEENGRIRMPISVEVNHAIMDGLHVGRYFERLQDLLDTISV